MGSGTSAFGSSRGGTVTDVLTAATTGWAGTSQTLNPKPAFGKSLNPIQRSLMATAGTTDRRSDSHAALDGRTNGLTRGVRRLRTETKAALKTTEFWGMVGLIVAILISAALIKGGDNGTDEFIARQAWLYVAILGGAYSSLADSRSRAAPIPTTTIRATECAKTDRGNPTLSGTPHPGSERRGRGGPPPLAFPGLPLPDRRWPVRDSETGFSAPATRRGCWLRR